MISANIYITPGTSDSRDTQAGVEVADSDIALDLDLNTRKKSRSVVRKLVHRLFKR